MRAAPLRLFALLAALALAVAVPASAPAKKAPKPAPAPAAPADTSPVLVVIGGQPITAADVDRRVAELPENVRTTFKTPDGRRQVLERMVEERVWLVASERAGVPDRPQVQRTLAQQRRDLFIRTYLTEIMAGAPAPTDSQAQVYYDQHIAEYQTSASVTLRHIQLRTEAEAKRVLAQARRGANWDSLCAKVSTDSLTRTNGGQLGTVGLDGAFASLGPQPALAESALALGSGKIGGPWRTDHGWSVVQVEAARPAGARPFDQVRGSIIRQLNATTSQAYYKARLDSLERALGVTPDSAAIQRFVSQKPGARQLFEDAQQAATPQARLALYQQLLADHPDADVAPQAQFMVGFIQAEELKDYAAAEQSFRRLLERYPNSELTASARWMLENMRTQEAPPFIEAAADSAAGRAPATGAGR